MIQFAEIDRIPGRTEFFNRIGRKRTFKNTKFFQKLLNGVVIPRTFMYNEVSNAVMGSVRGYLMSRKGPLLNYYRNHYGRESAVVMRLDLDR